MKLQFQKRSVLKLVSRTIPRKQGLMRFADNESQVSEAERTEICWTDYHSPAGTWGNETTILKT